MPVCLPARQTTNCAHELVERGRKDGGRGDDDDDDDDGSGQECESIAVPCRSVNAPQSCTAAQTARNSTTTVRPSSAHPRRIVRCAQSGWNSAHACYLGRAQANNRLIRYRRAFCTFVRSFVLLYVSIAPSCPLRTARRPAQSACRTPPASAVLRSTAVTRAFQIRFVAHKRHGQTVLFLYFALQAQRTHFAASARTLLCF